MIRRNPLVTDPSLPGMPGFEFEIVRLIGTYNRSWGLVVGNSYSIYPEGRAFAIDFERRTSAVFDEASGKWIEGRSVVYRIMPNQTLLIRHAGLYLFHRLRTNMMVYEALPAKRNQ